MRFEALKSELSDIAIYLDDPNVQDVIVNSDESICIYEAGTSGMRVVGKMDGSKTHRIIKIIASFSGKEILRENSILECEIPYYGYRFEGVLPPVVDKPSFAIRTKSSKIFTLNSYLQRNAIDDGQYRVIVRGVEEKNNIIFCGETGSGKTSIINSCTELLSESNERLVILEDTKELSLPNALSERLLTTPNISFVDLIRAALRMRPDRIIVGELRGKEALDFLKSMNTGHQGGMASIHANSAHEALHRLNDLCLEASFADKKKDIARTIDLVIFLSRGPQGPIVSEMIKVEGFDQDKNEFLFKRIGNEYQL